MQQFIKELSQVSEDGIIHKGIVYILLCVDENLAGKNKIHYDPESDIHRIKAYILDKRGRANELVYEREGKLTNEEVEDSITNAEEILINALKLKSMPPLSDRLMLKGYESKPFYKYFR